MHPLLRLAALFVLWGLMVVVAALLAQPLQPNSPLITSPETAHRVAGGNALLLLIGFGGSALLYFFLLDRAEGFQLLQGFGGGLYIYFWIAVLMVGLLPVLPWLGLDAEIFRLPESLKDLELRLEAQEKAIETLMLSLITHGELLPLLLFIAVVPGICEELFFRGALQNTLIRLMNPHLAIILTGVIFSLIHFQVYGLIPRALLGILMGYLVHASGRLAPAMWAHFLNNAYATILAYLGVHVFGRPEWVESTYRPPLWVALLGAAAAGAAIYALYRRYRYQRA